MLTYDRRILQDIDHAVEVHDDENGYHMLSLSLIKDRDKDPAQMLEALAAGQSLLSFQQMIAMCDPDISALFSVSDIGRHGPVHTSVQTYTFPTPDDERIAKLGYDIEQVPEGKDIIRFSMLGNHPEDLERQFHAYHAKLPDSPVAPISEYGIAYNKKGLTEILLPHAIYLMKK
ncbi:MAG: hypothetical protein ABIC95_02220 [archaeon]